jgi:hypothetical protein
VLVVMPDSPSPDSFRYYALAVSAKENKLNQAEPCG